MYLKKIVCENMGPISVVDITPGFHFDGNPKPLVIVGKNGTGKSILISNIVDSFIEFGNQAYSDIAKKAGTTNYYFKVAACNQIRIGNKSMICHLEYEFEDKSSPSPHFDYYQDLTNRGSIPKEPNDITYFNNNYNSGKVYFISDDKDFTDDERRFRKEFEESVIVYFPPERFFNPYWMGTAYSTSHDYGKISFQNKYTNELQKPIIAYNPTEDNTRWIIDVLTDAKAEIIISSEKDVGARDIPKIMLLEKSKKSIEQVLSCILNQDILLRLALRNTGKGRLKIISIQNHRLIAPTIDALSTGQILLLNIFLTIIRYAERTNLKRSYSLDEIKGIVVIDEIELHLHSDLQGSVLPRLIQMFPKVQFIITSHSPLFLLGMQDVFSDDGFDIVEMPDGNKIKAESFSEFRKAYEMVASTQLYREDIARKIKEIEEKNEKALIITEGSSDWKHMKRAWQKALKDIPKYAPLKDAFVFWEYEPPHTPPKSNHEIQMSDSELVTLCKGTAKLPHKGKIIFICDADNTKTTKDLFENNKTYKKWGNNVFSFQIPTPEHRKGQPVCIEHYYTDDEIRTPKITNGKECRLFLGNEFDTRGISKDGRFFCAARNSCGEGRIDIIEGDSKMRVTLIEDETQTVALSKTAFAEAILNEEGDFAKISSDSFSLIFDVLLEIIAPGSNHTAETPSSSDAATQTLEQVPS